VHADVRIIAATNADLQRAVAERRFREDLFYRLQVVPIRVPALAERVEDVQPLAAFFCAAACERHRLPRLQLSPNALRAVQAAEWPGNVRQLAHAIEAAVIRATGDRVLRIEREHVFTDAHGGPAPTDVPAGDPQLSRGSHAPGLARHRVEHLRDRPAARPHRTHIYNLIRAFGLKRERG
jgi:DNA-binding NtrC family response regulator